MLSSIHILHWVTFLLGFATYYASDKFLKIPEVTANIGCVYAWKFPNSLLIFLAWVINFAAQTPNCILHYTVNKQVARDGTPGNLMV